MTLIELKSFVPQSIIDGNFSSILQPYRLPILFPNLIPNAINNVTFQLRQSCRDSKILIGVVLGIQPRLRSLNRGAFTRSNVMLFIALGINPGRCPRAVATIRLSAEKSEYTCYWPERPKLQQPVGNAPGFRRKITRAACRAAGHFAEVRK